MKNRTISTILWILVPLVVAGIVLNYGYNYFLRQAYPLEYEEIVQEQARTFQIDEALVYAVIKAESNFDPDAVSHAGAMGLMQLTPETFDWMQTKLPAETIMEENKLFEPEINIRYGCKLLSVLLQKYPNYQTALCAYNAGVGRVDGWLEDPMSVSYTHLSA